MKFIKYFLVIILILAGLLALFYFLKPEQFKKFAAPLEHLIGRKILAQKIEGASLPSEKKTVKSASPVLEKETKSEDEFTNQDLFNVICQTGQEKVSDPLALFTGCSHCPSDIDSLNKENNFHFNYGVKGHFTRLDEEQALVFMDGCPQQEEEDGHLFLLKKGFGGWQKIGAYPLRKVTTFPPLFFTNSSGLTGILAKKKYTQKIENGAQEIIEDIVYLTFADKKLKEDIIFRSKTFAGDFCEDKLSTALGPLVQKGETGFQVDLEVIHEEAQSDKNLCPQTLPHPEFSKLPCLGNVALRYKFTDENAFTPEADTQQALTCLYN